MPKARSKEVFKKPTAKKVVNKADSKTTSTKSAASKSITKTTKTATKKATSSKSKAGLKKGTPAIKTKAAGKRGVAAKNSSTSQKSKPLSKSSAAHTAKEVVLPSRMSIRAREKALVWAEQFEAKTHKPAYALTMTLGVLFILFGSYTGLYANPANTCSGVNCAAQLLSSSDSDEETNTTTTAAPTVTLVGTMPAEITSDEEILVDTTHTARLNATLRFTGATGATRTMQLSTTGPVNNQFTIIIPGSDLSPNEYTVRVQPYDENNQSYDSVTLGTFTVPRDSLLSLESSLDTTDSSLSLKSSLGTSDSTLSLDSSLDTDDSTLSLDSSLSGSESTIETTNTVSGSKQSVDSSTSVTNESTLSESTDVVTVELESEPVQDPVVPANEITVSADATISGQADISIESSVLQSMSVYVRRIQGTQEQLAGRIFGRTVTFSLNTRDYPNGLYELTVRSTSLLDDTKSNSIQIRINNETEQISVAEAEATAPVIQEERDLLQITSPILQIEPVAEVTDRVLQSPEQSTVDSGSNEQVENQTTVETSNEITLDETIRGKVREQLGLDSDQLEDLFTRYAVAIQSGNPDMIREARNAVTAYRLSIVDQALANEQDRFIADDISKLLEDEIAQISRRVETFEDLRRERLGDEAGKDSDGDGITDLDEVLLYGTDPLKADTDGDGFTDGAEIIRGFDPLNAESEASIVYKSPKETIGIVANKNLMVTEVVPDVVQPQAEEEQSLVQAVVRGKGLPNSFVTLYIFSTPTIVTVRTEADGSFEYTFSKELEDGQHEVFVALTDNTGDIVAQSEPFTFVKQAEAFTAVDAQAAVSDVQSNTPSTSGASSYQAVLSMSVLALGILLIMLGVGLRANKPETIHIEAAA